MTQDLRGYFKGCTQNAQSSTTSVGIHLARGGIGDMETLCRLLEQEPAKVQAIRNIGPKRLEIIRRVCAAYRSEKGERKD